MAKDCEDKLGPFSEEKNVQEMMSNCV